MLSIRLSSWKRCTCPRCLCAGDCGWTRPLPAFHILPGQYQWGAWLLTTPRHVFWTSCEVWKDSISCRFKRHSSFFRTPTGSSSWSAQGVTQLPATVSRDCEASLGGKRNELDLCHPKWSWQSVLEQSGQRCIYLLVVLEEAVSQAEKWSKGDTLYQYPLNSVQSWSRGRGPGQHKHSPGWALDSKGASVRPQLGRALFRVAQEHFIGGRMWQQ